MHRKRRVLEPVAELGRSMLRPYDCLRICELLPIDRRLGASREFIVRNAG